MKHDDNKNFFLDEANEDWTTSSVWVFFPSLEHKAFKMHSKVGDLRAPPQHDHPAKLVVSSEAVSGEPTCRAPNGNFLGNRPVGPPTPICWEPTGLLPNARQPTCRLPNDNLLGSRQVCSRTPDSRPIGALTPICWGADMSGLQWPPMFDWL